MRTETKLITKEVETLVFVAEDGKEFESSRECIAYEAKELHLKKIKEDLTLNNVIVNHGLYIPYMEILFDTGITINGLSVKNINKLMLEQYLSAWIRSQIFCENEFVFDWKRKFIESDDFIFVFFWTNFSSNKKIINITCYSEAEMEHWKSIALKKVSNRFNREIEYAKRSEK